MSGHWTPSQVLTLAPDAGAAKAGQALAKPSTWATLGHSDRALWGEIQGSGKKPYQVRVDLSEPAFKCSCPSRKFPCKHGLGLLLILAENPDAIPPAEPPDWVADWLAGRTQRTEQRAAKAAETHEVDPEARAKRAAKREDKVRCGVDELARWLADLVRQGLGFAQAQPVSFWDNVAARMVDAQATGLARAVRNLADCVSGGEGWQERMLAAVGRLHLLLSAYSRIESLPDPLQADVRSAIGWTVPKDDLLKLPAVDDAWIVLGQRVEREEQLRVQRTWLWGQRTERPALILQFAAGALAFENSFMVGQQFHGLVHFFPSACPLRAIVASRADAAWTPVPLPAAAPAAARDEYLAALAIQPWIELWPMRLGGVVPRRPESSGAAWHLTDAAGHSLPLDARVDCGWHLLAISGGAPIEVFGEWDGSVLRPLSAGAAGRFFAVTAGEAAATVSRVA